MPKNKNTPPLPTVGHHREDGSYVEIPSIPGGSTQAPPVNPDSNDRSSGKSFKAHLSQNLDALPEPSTSPQGENGSRTLDSKANTYSPQLPDEIKEQNKQELLRHIREASKYKTSNKLEEEFSNPKSRTSKKDNINKTTKNRKKPKKDNSKLIKLIAVMSVIIASLIIIFGVGMALTKKENNLPPLITPKQEQYREKPKPEADQTLQKTARIYADGEGKVMSNKVEHILPAPEQPLSLEEIKKGKIKTTQENAPDTEGINSHIKDSHGFENEALNNKTKADINKETTQELMANAQNIAPKTTVKPVTPVPENKAKTDTKVKTPTPTPTTTVKATPTPTPTNKVDTKTVVKPVVENQAKTTSVVKPTTTTNQIQTSKANTTPVVKSVVKNTVENKPVVKPTPTTTANTTPVVKPVVANTNTANNKPKVTQLPAVVPKVAEKNYKWEVQLVATVSKPLAMKFWDKAVAKSAGVLNTPPVYKTVVVNKKSYIRLRTGNFKTRALAKKFCAKLKTLGIDCSPTSK